MIPSRYEALQKTLPTAGSYVECALKKPKGHLPNELHTDFIKKLDSIHNGDETLLDNTLCFYGSATSKTHRAILLSSGKTWFSAKLQR